MSFAPHKTRVGVLRGGPSREYEISLKTGSAILKNLTEEYEPVDILISRDGVWHEKGFPKEPAKILNRVDLVINGLHGTYGEDGEVQKLMDSFKIPYSGSGAIASAIAMNKIATKKIYRENSIKTPFSVNVHFENLSKQKIKEVYHSLPAPFVVKPSNSGSSLGVFVAHSLPELEEAMVAASSYSNNIIIEEFISGKEATCGVIENFRNTNHYPLLPIEIRHQSRFFDYDSKYKENGAEEICPGNFSRDENEMIKQMTVKAHQVLGLKHYSRSDFIVHPKRGIYILETNSLPGLTENSLLPKSLQAIGSNLKEFISHLIKKTLGKK